VNFQTSSEQLHLNHNFVYLYVTHPVTEHGDKLYIDVKLTLKRISKGQVPELCSSGTTFEILRQNCLCRLRSVQFSVKCVCRNV